MNGHEFTAHVCIDPNDGDIEKGTTNGGLRIDNQRMFHCNRKVYINGFYSPICLKI